MERTLVNQVGHVTCISPFRDDELWPLSSKFFSGIRVCKSERMHFVSILFVHSMNRANLDGGHVLEFLDMKIPLDFKP